MKANAPSVSTVLNWDSQRARRELRHRSPADIVLAIEIEQSRRKPRKALLGRLRGLLDSLANEDTMIPMAEDSRPRGAPEGNQNAAKDGTLDDTLTIRIKSSERAAYMKAKGKDGKLALWVREKLNEASGHPPP